MSIKDELSDELKDAMRTHDRNRADVIRQIKTEVVKATTASGFTGGADDELYRKTIASYAKRMRKALVDYEGYGERAAETATKLRFEVEYLSRWLPTALSEEDVKALVDAAVENFGQLDVIVNSAGLVGARLEGVGLAGRGEELLDAVAVHVADLDLVDPAELLIAVDLGAKRR